MSEAASVPARNAWVLLALAVAAADAHAQSTVVVLGQTLAMLGGAGGAVFGAIAGWRTAEPLRVGVAFLIYLGLLCVVASTWAGSLEIVPLTLVLGAAAGILPFGAGFFALRGIVTRLRAKIGAGEAT
jgi:hypothetical protein